MAEQKIDRRVRRTRESLRAALLALIMEKGYERITVQDIIDRADVGRSTFYSHFRDKEDLLVYGLEELRGAFDPAAGRDARPGASPTLAVFEHFARYHDVWKAMAGRRGAETFVRHLHDFLTELIGEQLRARIPAGDPRVPFDALVEFAVSTLIGLGIRWWNLGEKQYSPREIDRIYRTLTDPAIDAVIVPDIGTPTRARGRMTL